MTNNEKFNAMLNATCNPLGVYNALAALAGMERAEQGYSPLTTQDRQIVIRRISEMIKEQGESN